MTCLKVMVKVPKREAIGVPTFGQASLGTPATFSGESTFQVTSDEVLYALAVDVGTLPADGDPSRFVGGLIRRALGGLQVLGGLGELAAAGTGAVVAPETDPVDVFLAAGGIAGIGNGIREIFAPNAQQSTLPSQHVVNRTVTEVLPTVTTDTGAAVLTQTVEGYGSYGSTVSFSVADALLEAMWGYQRDNALGFLTPVQGNSVQPGFAQDFKDYGQVPQNANMFSWDELSSSDTPADFVASMFPGSSPSYIGGGLYEVYVDAEGSDTGNYFFMPNWLFWEWKNAYYTPTSGGAERPMLSDFNLLLTLIPVQYGN